MRECAAARASLSVRRNATRDRERADLPQPSGQSFSVYILHHQVCRASLLADIVKRTDVRMIQGRNGACLVREALPEIGLAGHFRSHEFQGNLAAKPRVDGRKTSPIPPAPITASMRYGPTCAPMLNRVTVESKSAFKAVEVTPSCTSSDSTSRRKLSSPEQACSRNAARSTGSRSRHGDRFAQFAVAVLPTCPSRLPNS